MSLIYFLLYLFLFKLTVQIVVNSEYPVKIHQQVSAWAEQLKADPSFTDSDVEELKSHLLDLTEKLKESGLNEDEAFIIALSRFGNTSVLKSEFEEVNTPIIQVRKAILVLSGILVYFLLYFFMLAVTRLHVILLFQYKNDPEQNIRYVLYQVIAFNLLLIISTIIIFFCGKKLIKKIVSFKIKPKHTLALFAGVFCIALVDQWLGQIIKKTFEIGWYTNTQLYTIFDYSGYSFPMIMIFCFIVLYRKCYLIISQESTNSELSEEWPFTPSFSNTERIVLFDFKEQLKDQFNNQLDDEEAKWVMMKRKGLLPPEKNDYGYVADSDKQLHILLIILSGALVYFFLYFLMYSTARIFFIVLQYFESDPLLNIKRIWSYVLVYQSFFVFFTASLYIKDKNLVKRIKQVHLKPIHTLLIFFATVVLSITDRCLYPLTQHAIGHDLVLIYMFGYVFYFSNYSFPFILWACFLVLFFKYYRDNIRI